MNTKSETLYFVYEYDGLLHAAKTTISPQSPQERESIIRNDLRMGTPVSRETALQAVRDGAINELGEKVTK